MAVTKLLLDDPPSADSSSVDGESESSGSETETETVNHRREEKNDDREGKENNSKPGSGSGSESESESDSEKSYTTPPSAGFAVKPADPTPKPKRKTSDGGEEASSSSEEEEKESKRKKTKKEEKKKKTKLSPPSANGGSARVWSEEDEVAILEGLSDFRSEKGSDPQSDAAEFHAFVSPRLSAEATKCQLYEKVRRLKKKYLNAAAEGGLSSSSASKPRDLRRFELSEKFWGAKAQSQTPAKKTKRKDVDLGEFRAEFPRLSESWRLISGPMGSESLARKMEDSMPLIRSSKAQQLERKWKQLEVEEVELRLQRSELARRTYQLILDAIIKPED